MTIAIYFEDLKQLYKHIAVGRLGNDMKQFAMFFSEIRLGYISLDIYIYMVETVSFHLFFVGATNRLRRLTDDLSLTRLRRLFEVKK